MMSSNINLVFEKSVFKIMSEHAQKLWLLRQYAVGDGHPPGSCMQPMLENYHNIEEMSYIFEAHI